MRRSVSLVAFVTGIATVALLSSRAIARQDTPSDVTVHEWGTFTAVAGPDGQAVPWLPLSGPTDLPCFVDHFKNRSYKILLADGFDTTLAYQGAQTRLFGRVRMETPVIYFYASRASTVQVDVRFPRGLMTEWYPSATVNQPDVAATLLDNPSVESRITWPSVEVRPGASPALPQGQWSSHYYAARDTDSAPIRVGDENEKFLFYRGVANFNVPITAVVLDDATVHAQNVGLAPIVGLVLFQNTAGRVGFQIANGPVRTSATFELPARAGTVDALRGELERLLVTAGLYPREAHAMVSTWGESWFEEGTRLFYIVPQSTIDSLLPLTIAPAPVSTARVFVGRLEVLTPEIQQAVRAAVAARDEAGVDRFGRFLAPIANLIKPSLTSLDQVWLDGASERLFTSYLAHATSCQ